MIIINNENSIHWVALNFIHKGIFDQIHQFKINSRITNKTILQIAILNEKIMTIKLLIKHGVSVTSEDMECAIFIQNDVIYNILLPHCPCKESSKKIIGGKGAIAEPIPIVNIKKCLVFNEDYGYDVSTIDNFIRKGLIQSDDFLHFIIHAMKTKQYKIAKLFLTHSSSNSIFYKKNKNGESPYMYYKGMKDFSTASIFNCYVTKKQENVFSTIINVGYRDQSVIYTITAIENVTIDVFFAVAQKRKLHRVLWSLLSKNTVNLLDSRGNSLMYYYITNAKKHSHVTIDNFIKYGGQIIINYVPQAFPYKTKSVELALKYPSKFMFTLKENNSIAQSLILCPYVNFYNINKYILKIPISPLHKNNKNETIIDTINAELRFSRVQKELLIRKLLEKYPEIIKLVDNITLSHIIKSGAIPCPLCRAIHVGFLKFGSNEFECVICMERRTTNIKLQCKHTDFCISCILQINDNNKYSSGSEDSYDHQDFESESSSSEIAYSDRAVYEDEESPIVTISTDDYFEITNPEESPIVTMSTDDYFRIANPE